jgi:membrane protease YdiL (CAAX protease family)
MDTLTQEPELHARRRTTYLWIETGVVLLVCVVPFIARSVADVHGLRPSPAPSPFVYHALLSLFENTGQIAVVLFIIWRSDDPFGRFGLRPFKIGRDLFGGIALCSLLRGTYHLLWWALRISLSRNNYFALVHSGIGSLYSSPSGNQEYILLAIMCVFSGFMQELVMRAYLIVRFEELFESTAVALFLSTVLFTSYHGYQGTGGIIGIAIFGLIQGIAFCLFRRLAPISLAHAINNFIAIGRITWL